MNSTWHVYMVLCRDGTLYTGITNDLPRRMAAHNSEKGGCRYTKYRQPVSLVYEEAHPSRGLATRREWQIKQMATTLKWSLVREFTSMQTHSGQ